MFFALKARLRCATARQARFQHDESARQDDAARAGPADGVCDTNNGNDTFNTFVTFVTFVAFITKKSTPRYSGGFVAGDGPGRRSPAQRPLPFWMAALNRVATPCRRKRPMNSQKSSLIKPNRGRKIQTGGTHRDAAAPAKPGQSTLTSLTRFDQGMVNERKHPTCKARGGHTLRLGTIRAPLQGQGRDAPQQGHEHQNSVGFPLSPC
jgi:hypothetical protein